MVALLNQQKLPVARTSEIIYQTEERKKNLIEWVHALHKEKWKLINSH